MHVVYASGLLEHDAAYSPVKYLMLLNAIQLAHIKTAFFFFFDPNGTRLIRRLFL